MARKLFCEISPTTYKISVFKCRFLRFMRDLFSKERFATQKQESLLPTTVIKHNSLIRRTLGSTDMLLQENKAVNLGISAPKVSGVLIRPGDTFSFWHLVGNTTAKKGYKEGLTISSGRTHRGVGGGMCQFTNLIHWMVLHTPLEITEHHHHDGYDLFPDFGRKIPFGTGTSILYNYLDYRFKNTTDNTYQLVVYTTRDYLCGELRCAKPQPQKYHIQVENERFIEESDGIYRVGEIYRDQVDRVSGNLVSSQLLRTNHAKVMYDASHLTISL